MQRTFTFTTVFRCLEWIFGAAAEAMVPGCIKKHIAPPCGKLTHSISLTVKMRDSRNILTGTVRMRTKGKASDAWVDMTAHRTAKHTTWRHVNRCIRSVRTWTEQRNVRSFILVRFHCEIPSALPLYASLTLRT